MSQLQTQSKEKFSVALRSDSFQQLIKSTLTDPKRAASFIASVSSAVANNSALQACKPASIIASALLGEALQLSPSPQLGQFYMVPYKKKAKIDYQTKQVLEPEETIAQFQMGYKGYIQLALRTGQYRNIIATDIREGELKKWNRITEVFEAEPIENDEDRETALVVGYYASFEYINGFKKSMYWTLEKMLNHANQYSQAFDKKAYEAIKAGRIQDVKKGQVPDDGYIAKNELWKYSSPWYSAFDDMANKTMLRQLIGKWGVMSADLVRAFERDGAEIRTDGSYDYIDSESVVIDQQQELEEVKQKTLPECTDEQFSELRAKHYERVSTGKKTAAQLIAHFSKIYEFSELQLAEIKDWELAND